MSSNSISEPRRGNAPPQFSGGLNDSSGNELYSPLTFKPAAKVALKVPLPDSLVEVRVSPPESNFEIKVSPGDDVIELLIRPGSSFVEVRISPPGDAGAKARLEAETKAGETRLVFPSEAEQNAPAALVVSQEPAAAETIAAPVWNEDFEARAAAGETRFEEAPADQLQEEAAEPSLEELLGDEPIIWTAQVNEPEIQAPSAEAEAEADDLPDTRLAADDDNQDMAFGGGLFVNVLDQDDEPAPAPQRDNAPPAADASAIAAVTEIDASPTDESLFPSVAGPKPEDLPEVKLEAGAEYQPPRNDGEFDTPRFVDIDEEADATDYWPPEEEGPAFGTAGSAAKVALARLSAAVEKERALGLSEDGRSDDALNMEDFFENDADDDRAAPYEIETAPVIAPEESSIMIDPRTSVEALGAHLAAYTASASVTLPNPYKMPAADATVMVQLYDDHQSVDPAAETATPLPEEDQFEISPMDDELAIGPIDVEALEDIDLEKSQLPRQRAAQTILRAKPMNTVIPSNTIVPE